MNQDPGTFIIISLRLTLRIAHVGRRPQSPDPTQNEFQDLVTFNDIHEA